MVEESDRALLHLLIVATNPKGLQTAQRYLERRDVICSVVKSVKDAVGYVTKHKPGFVMLSWNLEGVSPLKIMQVLTQSFSVKVIVFAERGDASTSIQIANCGAPYTLQMPINGPKILIRLQGILREEQSLKDNPERERTRASASSGAGDEDKGSIHFSSNGSRGADTIVMKGSASKDGTFDGTAGISSSGNLNSGTGEFGENSRQNSRGDLGSKAPGSEVAIGSDHKKNRTFGGSAPQGDPQLKGPRSQGILADSVRTVVKEVSSRTTEEAHAIEGTRQISVLTIKSSRFHGYLIAAHGANKKIDPNFATGIKTRLIEHLKKQGESMKNDEADFEMEIKKVEFGTWAEEFAEFVAISQHEDSELAVAFVGGDPELGRVETSAAQDMVSCQLKDLAVGEPVECDMFLHLRKNDKYVRYLKQGVPLTQEQKDRLLKKEVKDLHFNKSDLLKYKEYVGKSFLRNKLSESKVFVKKASSDKAVA